MELLFSNTEARSEAGGGVEAVSPGVGDPHSAQNRAPGTNGLPHVMQNEFIFISNQNVPPALTGITRVSAGMISKRSIQFRGPAASTGANCHCRAASSDSLPK